MHEVSVIKEIVDSVQEEIQKYPDSRVESVSLKVGKMRQFVPDIMKFCYSVATKETPLEGSQLLLEEVPVRIYCRYCNLTLRLDEYDFHCPDCQAVDVQVVSGNELVLESIKLSVKESEKSMVTMKGESSWK